MSTARAIKHLSHGIAAILLASQAAAQHPALRPPDIGMMVQVALDSLLPPTIAPSNVPLEKRGLYFDRDRTFAAFGVRDTVSVISMGLRREVLPGAAHMLAGCSQLSPGRCERLGWRTYVWLQPLTISDSVAVVRAWIHWAHRSEPFREGVAPRDSAYLTGFLADLKFTRGPGAREWSFDRITKRGTL